MKKLFNSNTNNFYQSSAYLERPRLQRLLEDAMKFPLVAVYAGSGYGKTRCVYSFLQKYDAFTTWIQITERDNVATRFWESLIHMISISWPEAGMRFAEIGFPESDEAFSKFEAVVRKADKIRGKHIMVYDDFHLLHNPAVLRFFERAVNILPPDATVILLSRVMPEINIVGMTLNERIFSIHEDMLCFTEEEIVEYFNQLMLPLGKQEAHNIYEDTQGWAFAVNLIGRALRKNRKYERHTFEAMKTNVFKLIEKEVSPIVSDRLWRFLLRISLVENLTASLIRVLAEDETLISEMELLNAYIRYDSFLDAYVVHHLFLDYLRQNNHILTEKEILETCQKAGKWCESNNYQADALSYYEKSGDYDAIIQIVYSFDGQIPQDMARYVLEIFDRIPAAEASRHPLFPAMDLKIKIGLGMLEESSQLAEKYANDYEARPESPEKNRGLLGIYHAWGLLRLIRCPYTGIFDFDEYFKKASEYSEKSPFTETGPSTNQSLGAWVTIAGDTCDGAMEKFAEAAARSVPYLSNALNGNMYGFDDLAKGEMCFYRYEFDKAENYLLQAQSNARSRNQYDIQNRALFYLMRIASLRGNLTAVNEALESMKKLLDEKDYVIRYTTYDVACGFYYLALNIPGQVPDWLKSGFSECAHLALLDNYANRAKALYHFLTRQYGALLAFIERVRNRPTFLLGKIGMKVAEALSLYQLKNRDKAFAVLAEAHALAAPNKIITSFVQYGKDMRTLTAAVLREGKSRIPEAWLEDINRKSSAYAKKQAHMISEYRINNNLSKGISLSKRETEILKDLSHGLSRTEIAASQNLSVNTVKTVISMIYEKLYANNLIDAVRIAIENKII